MQAATTSESPNAYRPPSTSMPGGQPLQEEHSLRGQVTSRQLVLRVHIVKEEPSNRSAESSTLLLLRWTASSVSEITLAKVTCKSILNNHCAHYWGESAAECLTTKRVDLTVLEAAFSDISMHAERLHGTRVVCLVSLFFAVLPADTAENGDHFTVRVHRSVWILDPSFRNRLTSPLPPRRRSSCVSLHIYIYIYIYMHQLRSSYARPRARRPNGSGASILALFSRLGRARARKRGEMGSVVGAPRLHRRDRSAEGHATGGPRHQGPCGCPHVTQAAYQSHVSLSLSLHRIHIPTHACLCVGYTYLGASPKWLSEKVVVRFTFFCAAYEFATFQRHVFSDHPLLQPPLLLAFERSMTFVVREGFWKLRPLEPPVVPYDPKQANSSSKTIAFSPRAVGRHGVAAPPGEDPREESPERRRHPHQPG